MKSLGDNYCILITYPPCIVCYSADRDNDKYELHMEIPWKFPGKFREQSGDVEFCDKGEPPSSREKSTIRGRNN